MDAPDCSRCGGKGYEPSPTGVPQIGAPSCMGCGGARKALGSPLVLDGASVSDVDFWERVFAAHVEPAEYDPAHEAIGPQLEPCQTCGERGACGWDAEGRPLIHANDNNEET